MGKYERNLLKNSKENRHRAEIYPNTINFELRTCYLKNIMKKINFVIWGQILCYLAC